MYYGKMLYSGGIGRRLILNQSGGDCPLQGANPCLYINVSAAQETGAFPCTDKLQFPREMKGLSLTFFTGE